VTHRCKRYLLKLLTEYQIDHSVFAEANVLHE